MIHGAEYLARSPQNSIAETQTVEAARGDILDRYGRVLVSNRVTYQVALNTDAMEKTATTSSSAPDRLPGMPASGGDTSPYRPAPFRYHGHPLPSIPPPMKRAAPPPASPPWGRGWR